MWMLFHTEKTKLEQFVFTMYAECYCCALTKCHAYFKPNIINGKYTCLNKFIVWEKKWRNEKLLCKTTENMSWNNWLHLRLTLCFPISNEKEPKDVGDPRLWPYAFSQCTQYIHLCCRGDRIFSYHFRHLLDAVGCHYEGSEDRQLY